MKPCDCISDPAEACSVCYTNGHQKTLYNPPLMQFSVCLSRTFAPARGHLSNSYWPGSSNQFIIELGKWQTVHVPQLAMEMRCLGSKLFVKACSWEQPWLLTAGGMANIKLGWLKLNYVFLKITWLWVPATSLSHSAKCPEQECMDDNLVSHCVSV